MLYIGNADTNVPKLSKLPEYDIDQANNLIALHRLRTFVLAHGTTLTTDIPASSGSPAQHAAFFYGLGSPARPELSGVVAEAVGTTWQRAIRGSDLHVRTCVSFRGGQAHALERTDNAAADLIGYASIAATFPGYPGNSFMADYAMYSNGRVLLDGQLAYSQPIPARELPVSRVAVLGDTVLHALRLDAIMPTALAAPDTQLKLEDVDAGEEQILAIIPDLS